MAAQEGDAARIGHARGRPVVGRPLLAVEGVVGARIDVALELGELGQGLLDLRHRRRRHEAVVAGEMQQQRALDLLGFLQILLDIDAVIADGRIDAGPRRGEIGELAAQAIAQCRDLAVAALDLAQRVDRRLDVLGGLVLVEALIEIEGPLEILLAIAELDIGLEAMEEVRRQDEIALLGILIGDLADMAVDAEDLLAEQDAGALAARRRRQIAAEDLAVPVLSLTYLPLPL